MQIRQASIVKDVTRPASGGGGGGCPSLYEASYLNGDVPLDGVAFSIELLEWGRTFSDFWVRQYLLFTVSQRTRMFMIYEMNHI